MRPQVKRLLAGLSTSCLMVVPVACTGDPRPTGGFPAEPFQSGTVQDTAYRFYPGDELEVNVFTAPELSRTTTVSPDGRVQLSLGPPVIAMGRTAEEVRRDLQLALSGELQDPSLSVIPVSFASQQIFVGGEVAQPGMQELPGQIDPLQAIIMAGGLTDDARSKQVVLLRRLPDGQVRSAVLDVESGIFDARLASWTPLRRFDVVYVPKSKIAEENLFVQKFIRDALPLQFQLFFDVTQF